MSSEIEVGGVVLRVRAVAIGVDSVIQQIQSASQIAGQSVQQITTTSATAATKAKETLTAVSSANAAAANFGGNTDGVDKYTLKLDTLNSKYDLQSQKVQKLGADLDTMASQYMHLIQASGGDFDLADIAPEITAKYDAELVKLDELRNSIRLTEQERANAAAKAQTVQDAAIRKQELLNQKLTDKTVRADAKIGMDTAAMAIRGVSSAAGGAVGQIGYLASEIVFLKRTMDTAVGPAAAMGAAISGGIMIAVTAISAIVGAMQQAKEEAQQAASEAAKAYRLVSDELAELSRNITVLESQSSTLDEVAEAREALAKTFPRLIIGYNEENKAILTTVDALKEEAEYRKILMETKREEAAAGAAVSADKYAEVANQILSARLLLETPAESRNYGNFAGSSGLFGGLLTMFKNDEQILLDTEKKSREQIERFEELKANFTAKLEKLGGEDVAKAFTGQLEKWLVPDKFGKIDVDKIAGSMIGQYEAAFNRLPEDIQKLAGTAGPEIQAAIQQIIGGSLVPVGPAADVTGQIKALLADGNLMTSIKEFEALASRITGGVATNADMQRYTELLVQMEKAVSGNSDVFRQLSNASLDAADKIKDTAAAAAAAKASYLDAAKSVSDVYSAFQKANDELKDIGAMKAAAQALEAGKSVKDYGDALSYVADKYGVTKDEAAGMAGTLRDEISIKETLMEATIRVGEAQVLMQIRTIESMRDIGTVTAEESQRMINSLNKVSEKYASLLNSEGGLNTDKMPVKLPSKSVSSGSSGNEALQNQLSLLEHKRKMDDLTYSEEIAWLKRIRSQHAQTAEERQDIDEKLYTARKAQMQAELDHKKAMDQLTLAEEISAVENMLRQYRKGTSERISLEEQLYSLKKQKAQEDYDLQVYYGRLNLQQQEAYLRRQIQSYKANTAQRIELEKQLYDVQQEIRQRNIDQLDRLADGVVTALENRYEEQRKIEEKRIRDSIDAWESWADEQVSVLQAQIDALDDLTKSEDRAEEERKRQRKIAALEQQLQYETDVYNQRQLQQEIQKAQEELQKWLDKNARADQKDALQDQIKEIQDRASAEKDALQDQLDANNDYFDELTKSYKLQAEAQRMVAQSNQAEIINLIKAFAPEYNITGQTLGEQLVDGFTSKVKSVETWFENMNAQLQRFQTQAAQAATWAADQFWQSRGGAPAGMQAAAPVQMPSQVVLNFYKEVKSPSEVARALNQTLEDFYRMY